MKLFGNTGSGKYAKNSRGTVAGQSQPASRATTEQHTYHAPPVDKEFWQYPGASGRSDPASVSQNSRPVQASQNMNYAGTSRREGAVAAPAAQPARTYRQGQNAAYAQKGASEQGDYASYGQRPRSGGQASAPAGRRKRSKKRKRRNRLIALAVTVCVLVCLYLTAVFSNIPFIKKWREIYIQTAMSTMSHQWLATAFIPRSVIDDVMARQEAARQSQIGVNSTLPPISTDDEPLPTEGTAEDAGGIEISREQQDFYKLFWELDMDSMELYLKNHPEALANGYDNIYINEAGLNDDGIDVYTTMGEQVLAIDAKNEILLVRVKGSSYRGVMAIAKDPARLSLCAAKGIGSYGEYAGSIAERNNGLLAITGSGFIDDGGSGNGGTLAGYCKCEGVSYGNHRGWGSKRIELKEDNWFYITDAPNACGDDVTDAVEFEPAMVVNGTALTDMGEYTSINPRACIGQSKTGEILMLVIEGRFLDSMGCPVIECVDIMMRHNCLTAMNLDGGTSAIMWYDGEYVTRCSNTALPYGRTLPNAWVYAAK